MKETVEQTDCGITLTWQPNYWPEPGAEIRQVDGLCLTLRKQLVLVSKNGNYWTLPGGKPEVDESPIDTLRREVLEEACAIATSSTYLGAQRVDDPDSESNYYQLRYLVTVNLQKFSPRFEMRHRRCVGLNAARKMLWNGASPIGSALIDLAAAQVR